jgi:hypothetical protein
VKPKLYSRTALIDCPAEVVNLALELHLAFRRQYSYVIELLTGMERTLWAEINGRPAGVFLWTVYDHGRRWWVDFCGIKEEFRKRGVYVALRREFRKHFDADKLARCFESHVKMDNHRMKSLNELGGSKAVSIKFRFDKGV